MVTQKTTMFKIADSIRDGLKVKAYDLLGIYDLVVELNAETIAEIDKYVRKIKEFPLAASTTTYLATDEKTKPEPELKRPAAYVLVNTTPLRVNEVRDQIYTFEGVQKADIVWGPYDIVLEVHADSLSDFVEMLQKAYLVTGIVKTVTLLTYPEERQKPA